MFLTIRTDNPDAEIGLYDSTGKELHYHKWHADRSLAKDLLRVIRDQLKTQNKEWADVRGVVAFEGPGSFTGLRIGLTVANTLAYGQHIPIVAARGEDWRQVGVQRLIKGEDDRLVLPHYGAEANITMPKK